MTEVLGYRTVEEVQEQYHVALETSGLTGEEQAYLALQFRSMLAQFQKLFDKKGPFEEYRTND